MNCMKQQSKLLAIDLDDTLCYRPEGIEHLKGAKYLQCLPMKEHIELINKLHDAGHTIVIYTARGIFTYKMDVSVVYDKLFELTNNQLKSWGVKYHKLVMGKHPFDFLLDDKALSLNEKYVLENLL